MVRHMRDALFGAFAHGQIVEHAEHISRFPVRSHDRQPRRTDYARAVTGRYKCLLIDKDRLAGFDQFTIFRVDGRRGAFRHDFEGSLAEH